jgi:DNA repair protein SbcD/Mre11
VSGDIRILFLADSHLGLDLPVRPRVERRRRGHDFLANYATALAPALAGEVDLVVHGGDVFDRSRPVPSTAYLAYEPLRCIADRGVPVFIVPGNHERSRLPHARLVSHANVHVFDQARTFVADVRGTTIALSGFPYERDDVRTRFPGLLESTGWRRVPAMRRLLCMHHCVEGATVGPADFMFTTASDVVRVRDVPDDFAAVLSGHIHRHQMIVRDLAGRPLKTPIFYPGSIERTSLAEVGETKGYMMLRVGRAIEGTFRSLPARPMIREQIVVDGLSATALESSVRAMIEAAPCDAVLFIRVAGALTDEHWRCISAPRVRAMAPDSMNVEIRPDVQNRNNRFTLTTNARFLSPRTVAGVVNRSSVRSRSSV